MHSFNPSGKVIVVFQLIPFVLLLLGLQSSGSGDGRRSRTFPKVIQQCRPYITYFLLFGAIEFNVNPIERTDMFFRERCRPSSHERLKDIELSVLGLFLLVEFALSPNTYKWPS